jgi:hypothetical protein
MLFEVVRGGVLISDGVGLGCFCVSRFSFPAKSLYDVCTGMCIYVLSLLSVSARRALADGLI